VDTHEQARRRIYEQTRAMWDEDTAEASMTVLPKTGELATKHDLECLEHELVRAIEVATRTTIVTILGVVAGGGAAVVGLVQLLR
jgi:hypothetical protein